MSTWVGLIPCHAFADWEFVVVLQVPVQQMAYQF